MSRLDVRGVGLEYPGRDGDEGVTALQGIDLTMEDRDFVVALGPSGCGKTSLLNLMAGFIRPTSGSITLDGREVDGPGPERGVVFQQHALLPWLNVAQNAEFGLKLQGVNKKDRRERAMHFLSLVGLAESADRAIHQLSGGMRQRLGLARVLAGDPRTLLMDEPFGALDALTRETMQELILKVFEGQKKSVFFITHSVEEALFMATELVVLSPRPGRITHRCSPQFSSRFLSEGDARAVKSDPAYIAMREETLAVVRSMEQNGG